MSFNEWEIFYLPYEVDDEADEADWEAEYLELTNEDDFPYLSGQSLQDFYNRISIVRSTFKKSTENAHGTFGAEEIYDITSEVSYSTAMNDMKDAMRDFVSGTDLSTVWSGLTSENIARTYMMAKNIVENERVESEYAYYNIGTNVINSTPGLDGNEYILVDFERIKLKEPLYKKDAQGNATIKTYVDTDMDGIYDRDELGNDGKSYEFYDITKFIEKMVLAELYGKDQKELTDEDKKRIMTGFKKNLIQRRLDEQITDGSGDSVLNTENKIDRHEQAEYYLNCFTSSDTDGTHYADITNAESSKIKVKLYSFNSNPIFKDTDFDGVPDGFGYKSDGTLCKDRSYNDTDPQNNAISGTMNTNSFSNVSATSHMDYRYFFMNNKNYYDELSTMSLLLCNTLERHNDAAGTGDLSDITTLFRKIGLKKWDETDDVLIKTATYGTNGKVEYVVGENEIEYAHNYDENVISKKVKLIAIKSIDAGYDNIEKIGKNERNNAYSSNNHELFDGLAQDIYKKEFKGQEFAYWITGYNTGGAVANILSAMMIDNGLYYIPKGGIASNSNLSYYVYDNGQLSPQSVHERVISNVYAYTFGAPYTVYNGDDEKSQVNSIQSKYASIFNVVSNNDIYPFIHTNNYKWGRYGVSCYKKDGKENFIENAIYSFIDSFDEMPSKYKRQELLNALNGIFSPVREVFDFDNKVNYRTEYYEKNQEVILRDIFRQIMNGYANIAINTKIDDPVLYGKYLLFTNKLNNNNLRGALKLGKDEKVYYDLSKKILPEDLTFVVNSDEEFRITNKVRDGIDYDRFPCYQTLGKAINVNNEVPIMFQTEECWSDFRYGTKYNEKDGEYKVKEKDKTTGEIVEKVLYSGKMYDETTGYSYGTFHESACACSSLAMTISFERKETITPVDVRNMWEENTDSYRTNTNSGTDHEALNIACERFGLTNLAFRERTTNTAISYNSNDGSFTVKEKNAYALINYLIKGHPIIARCPKGEFTKKGHFIVISAVNSDDVKKYTKEDGTIDSKDYGKIRIYVSDPEEGHKKSKKEYHLDTFSSGKNTEKYWVFDGTNKGDCSLDNGYFNYLDNNQSEWFYEQNEKVFKEYKMKSRTWEDPK